MASLFAHRVAFGPIVLREGQFDEEHGREFIDPRIKHYVSLNPRSRSAMGPLIVGRSKDFGRALSALG